MLTFIFLAATDKGGHSCSGDHYAPNASTCLSQGEGVIPILLRDGCRIEPGNRDYKEGSRRGGREAVIARVWGCGGSGA